MAADEKITETASNTILPEFERMINILGIKIHEVSDDEINEINELITKRDQCREKKDFVQADKIREQIAENNIIFIDHKNSTRWVKQENIQKE